MSRGTTCALVIATLLAGGCGSDNGRDRADSGSTGAKRPSRAFEGATAGGPKCVSNKPVRALSELKNITCEQWVQVID